MCEHEEGKELFGPIFSRCLCGDCNQERSELMASLVKQEELPDRLYELAGLKVGLIDYLSRLETELKCRLRVN